MSAEPSELSREAGRKMSRVETYFSFVKIHGKINYLCLLKQHVLFVCEKLLLSYCFKILSLFLAFIVQS